MSGMQGPILNYSADPKTSSHLRTQTATPSRCWTKFPRRYLVAVMFSLAFLIRGWMMANIAMVVYHFFILEGEARALHLPTISNFTADQMEEMIYLHEWANVIGQIPAAMSIIHFSPHKIMETSIFLSSFLQIITPWTLKMSNIGFVIILFLQGLCSCPLECACIGLWREWAPSTERTRLLMLSFSGLHIYLHLVFTLCIYLAEAVSPMSSHYFAGIAGIVWCILWSCLIKDSPSNDPLISEAEQQYLEDNVPSESKEKITVKSVPYKSIIKSLPVFSLCLVFVSSAFSSRSMVYFIAIQLDLLISGYVVDWMQWTLAIHCIIIVPAIGVLVDVVINRKIISATTVRKTLVASGLVIHAIFMLLFMIPNVVASAMCFLISFMVFPVTLVGILPNVLELSPRYATATMGLAMTVYSLSSILYDIIQQHLMPSWSQDELFVSLIPVELLAILAAIMFAIYGSAEKQMWSNTRPPADGHDSQYYPATDLEDEMLVTGDL